MKSLLLAMAVLVLSYTSTLASTTFNFAGPGELQDSYSFTSDDITITASPADFTQGGNVSPAHGLYQSRNGLGVYNKYGDDSAVDGQGPNDLVVFKFSKTVLLESVTFSSYTQKDDFSLFFDVDGDESLKGDNISFDLEASRQSGEIGIYDFSPSLEGVLFGIGANDSNDVFEIASMTVSAVSVVPLPAALPLYGAGLVVLGFVGWRRKQRKSND